MYNIPWELYSEEEIQELLTSLFKDRGYQVYNLHKVDRSGEAGVDLECTRKGEMERMLVAVKIHPGSKDVKQLETFASHRGTKIYVHTKEPTTRFKAEISKLSNKVSFWDSKKLSSEILDSNLGLYLFLVAENCFEKELFDITLQFCRIYIDLEKKKRECKPLVKADLEMLNLLWNAKDRSASLHKSLRTLQSLFEESDYSAANFETKESVISAFFYSLNELKKNSLLPLKQVFTKFLNKYPGNFDRFCAQTSDRSNWMFFLQNLPQLSHGYLIKSFEKANQEHSEIKELLDKMDAKKPRSDNEEHLGEILGDLSRVLANTAYWLEDTVDGLFSIGLLDAYDALRSRFPGNHQFSN